MPIVNAGSSAPKDSSSFGGDIENKVQENAAFFPLCDASVDHFGCRIMIAE